MKNNIIKYVIIGLGLLAAGIFLKNLFKDKPKQNEAIINDWKKDVFGKPNEKKFINDAEVLVYYFDTLCDAQEQDKCYAEFYFKSGLLTTTEFLCE